MVIDHQKNTAFDFPVPAVDKDAIDQLKSGITPTLTAYRLSGGVWSSFTPATGLSEFGSTGTYRLILSVAECNYEALLIIITHASMLDYELVIRLDQQWPPMQQVTVAVDAVVGALDPGNRFGSPVALDVFKGQFKEFRLTQLDADGNAIDQTGKTLRFVVIDTQNPPVDVFQVENADMSLEDGGTVMVVPITPTQSTLAGDEYKWLLWDISTADEEVVLLHGALFVAPATMGT